MAIYDEQNSTMMARIEELEKQLAEEKSNKKQQPTRQVEIKVSYKKCVQINGLRRFPITMYKRELLKILEKQEDLKTFMKDHENELA
jgi:allophanate hydrolase subunit 1